MSRPCLLAFAALAAFTVSLLPGAFLPDVMMPSPGAEVHSFSTTQAWLKLIIMPPNALKTLFGGSHLEYMHMLEPLSGSSPAHDITGCACTLAEMRNDFLAVAWPFWFVAFVLAGLALRYVVRRLLPRGRDATTA